MWMWMCMNDPLVSVLLCPQNENSEHILIFISYLSPSTTTQIENEKMLEKETHHILLAIHYTHPRIETHEIGLNQIKYGKTTFNRMKRDFKTRFVRDMRKILDQMVNRIPETCKWSRKESK